MENAQRDPITGEIGKTIIFCVRQKHATKVTQILNQLADEMFPDKYKSDFAVQITSQVSESQEMAGKFANNNLLGKTRFLPDYKSSRVRACVTVGMMTTGFDCRDILNLVMLRPIFSPTDFVQMKGRGTRKYTFHYDNRIEGGIIKRREEKEKFYLFDFFANCEYFEEKFDYDEVLQLPPLGPCGPGGEVPEPPLRIGGFEYTGKDILTQLKEENIGADGMKVDRMMYQKFEQDVKADETVRQLMENEDFSAARNYVLEHYLNQKETALNLDKIRHILQPDRNVTLDEILQLMFGLIPKLKSKEELLEEEFKKFQSIYKLDNAKVKAAWRFFAAFITDANTREIIKKKKYPLLATNAMLGMEDISALNDYNEVIQAYIRDYVPLNKFE
jgi:type I restriction enzyme R subunit